jgi:5-(aminomethyl)-3-furanmethanol phosphate kinase
MKGPRAIVKLGGSLADSTLLIHWLRAIVRSGSGRIAIVPGGGVFADQVRSVQARWRLPDAVAHRMAILAMEQYGLALASRTRGLVPCASMAAIERAFQRGLVPVWQPLAMVDRATDIARSWRVTSDTLAAWLAGRLHARVLVLVKSRPIERADSAAAVELARRGVVDAALPAQLRRSGASLAVVGKGQWRRLPQLLAPD